MGSGSSRSGRAPRRRRSPDSHRPGVGGAAAEGGAAPRGPAPAPRAAADQDPGPAAPPDGRDETLRLLDQLLAESETWGSLEPPARGPARPRPAAGAGGAAPPERSSEDCVGSSSIPEAPGSSHRRPEKQEKQCAVSYDPLEEELMASIEREYCPEGPPEQASGQLAA
ncbi:cystin-1 [Lepus europaeus]|uniref:cystin-1 n=1 Tax=Lepus europaeus TaxID=9983 RepID=UPI002B4A95D8|nr:cystin-1 [Lepus europaeus]